MRWVVGTEPARRDVKPAAPESLLPVCSRFHSAALPPRRRGAGRTAVAGPMSTSPERARKPSLADEHCFPEGRSAPGRSRGNQGTLPQAAMGRSLTQKKIGFQPDKEPLAPRRAAALSSQYRHRRARRFDTMTRLCDGLTTTPAADHYVRGRHLSDGFVSPSVLSVSGRHPTRIIWGPEAGEIRIPPTPDTDKTDGLTKRIVASHPAGSWGFVGFVGFVACLDTPPSIFSGRIKARRQEIYGWGGL